MKKSFLVTVSNDYEQLTGIEFVCSFFKQLSEHQITLLHICRLDAVDANKSLLQMWNNPDERVTGKPTIGAKKALNKAVEMLSKSEMSVDQMITKTFAERFGKVKDILNEGQSGLYDAIILGKRASYTLQWFFERAADETANEVIRDSALTTPIWICPLPEIGRKNVLVCIDGSEGSLRGVDHAGYILSRQDQHAITLFHVEDGSGFDDAKVFGKAKEILHEHNIGDDRITTKSTWGINIASTITDYAEKKGYAAIAIGVEGSDEGLLKRINFGSLTSNLITQAEKVTVWCAP